MKPPTLIRRALLSGLATALGLFILLWFPAGAGDAIMHGWCSPLVGDSLFYYQMLPCCLMIILVGGTVSVGSRRNRKYPVATVALCSLFILVQGYFVRSATSVFSERLPNIEKQISINLAAVPDNSVWVPQFRRFPFPVLNGCRCGDYLAGKRITVTLSSRGKVESARVSILTALEAGAERNEVIKDLKFYGVREQMLIGLTQVGSWTSWAARSGRYSLSVSDY